MSTSSLANATKRNKLDRIDRRILKDLQFDGRMTNVELAKRAGISAPPCLRRVRALEEQGFIKGYHADLDARLLGYEVIIFAQVGLANQSEHDLKRFQDMIDSWPQVRESYMLAGDADFLLKVVATSWDDYQKFLTTKLTSAPNVAQVRSSLAIGMTKRKPGVPLSVDGRSVPNDDPDSD